MYPKDGSTHFSGILNEKNTVKVMQSLGLLSNEAHLLGGTKNKADWEDRGVFYSGKHKNYLTTGSFDWVNTTKVDSLKSDELNEFVTQIKVWAELPEQEKSRAKFVQSVRNQFKEATSSALDGCSPEKVKGFLKAHFVEPNKDIRCVITESSSRRLFVFPALNHPAIKLMDQGFEPVLIGAAQGSRKIVFKNGEEEVDCGLRLRLVSNNGVKAFLGLTRDKNGRKKTSSVVAKLQQDNVHKLVEMVAPEVFYY